MRRADRLFQIIQRLRRSRAVTAAQLAEALGVSKRTIYRDIQDLGASGVPILGEAGVGYVLGRTYDLPPLMFDGEELEALALGAKMVRRWADLELARAADSLLSKVEAVIPDELRGRIERSTLFSPDFSCEETKRETLGGLRRAIRESRRVSFDYIDREGAASRRTVRALALFHWGEIWTLGAWCELRRDFRTFRVDRVAEPRPLEEFLKEEGRTLEDLFRRYAEEDGGNAG